MAYKRVSVINESTTGRNTHFRDNKTSQTMTRAQFVKQIESGAYNNYHVRTINGVKTPASNPDTKKGNNLG